MIRFLILLALALGLLWYLGRALDRWLSRRGKDDPPRRLPPGEDD